MSRLRVMGGTFVFSLAFGGYMGYSSAKSMERAAKSADCSASSAPKAALNPKEFVDFTLVSQKKVTHNTAIYRFAFPEKDMVSGIQTASVLMAKAEIDGKAVSRPYTPISKNSEKGFMDLIIKTYPAPAGIMSRHIESLAVGDKLSFKGPFIKFAYVPNMKKKIGMIAGGSGLTPMLQVVNEILDNPNDKTEVSLLFANVTEDDIILRKELDSLAQKHKNFKVHYTLDKPSSSWKFEKGFVSTAMLEKYMPKKDEENVLVLVCGPKGMMDHVSGDKLPDRSQGEVGGLLKTLGYNSDQVFKF